MTKIKNLALALAAFAALALGGSAIATAASGGGTTKSQHPGLPPRGAFPAGKAPGTAAHEEAEKTVTGEAAEKAKAAALASVGSGTAGEVTTDLLGNGYELTVTKSDGSKVEVHLDSSFKVVKCPGGPPPGADGHAPPRGVQPGSFSGSAPQAQGTGA